MFVFGDFLALFLFGAFIVFIGVRKQSKTERVYLVANRSIGFFALIATLVMTEFNTATLFTGLLDLAFGSFSQLYSGDAGRYIGYLVTLGIPGIFCAGVISSLWTAQKYSIEKGTQ